MMDVLRHWWSDPISRSDLLIMGAAWLAGWVALDVLKARRRRNRRNR